MRFRLSAMKPYDMIQRGNRLEYRGKYAAAEKFYRMAADAGEAEGMRRLSELLRLRCEYVEAAKWLRSAAEHGHLDTMLVLAAQRRERGDRAGAERWYREAAERGSDVGKRLLADVVREREEWEAEKRRLIARADPIRTALPSSPPPSRGQRDRDNKTAESDSPPKVRMTLGGAVAEAWAKHQDGWGASS